MVHKGSARGAPTPLAHNVDVVVVVYGVGISLGVRHVSDGSFDY